MSFNNAGLWLLLASGATLGAVWFAAGRRGERQPVESGSEAQQVEAESWWFSLFDDPPESTANQSEGVPVLEDLSNEPRGIRNHNPTNIEHHAANDWNGLDNPPSDGRYCRFIDARYGIRATVKIIEAYKRRGILDLRGIIRTWAPDTENNTAAYVASVSQRSGIGSFTVINETHYPQLIDAMIYHENGKQPYSMDFIREGISWA